jgi:hypothetical protein
MAIRRFLLLAALLAWLPSASHAQFDIYPVAFSGKGVIQGFAPEPVLLREGFTTNEVINLARGRAPDAVVPANEILAIGISCESTFMPLLVFDANDPDDPLAFVGFIDVDSEQLAFSERGAVWASILELEETGDETNGISDGQLMMGGTAKFDEEGCPIALSASGVGHVEVFVDGEALSLIVAKGAKLRTLGAAIANILIVI